MKWRCIYVDKSNRLTEGVIWKGILIFFSSVVLGSFFQQLYNTADAIIVGQFIGKEALSAVGGLTGTLISLLVDFFSGVSTGVTVIIAQYYGAKKKEDVSQAVHTGIALAIIGGLLIMILGISLAPIALKKMGTPNDILQQSIWYIRIYFLGIIPSLIYNMGSGILRAVGNLKKPLYFLVISCTVNIILDISFVIIFNMGIFGVAIASVLAQFISAALVCRYLMKTDNLYKLSINKIKLYKEKISGILIIGIPAGCQSLMYSVTNIINQANINRFGTDTIAAWTAYTKIGGLFFMVMGAFGVSITTFVGQNYGARNMVRVRKGIKQCLQMTLIITVLMSSTFYVLGKYILCLFTKDTQVIGLGVEILHFMVPTYITYIGIEIFSGALRGMGDTIKPLIITGFGVCFLRILWLLFIVPKYPDIKTVIVSLPISWLITTILFVLYFLYFIKRKDVINKSLFTNNKKVEVDSNGFQ